MDSFFELSMKQTPMYSSFDFSISHKILEMFARPCFICWVRSHILIRFWNWKISLERHFIIKNPNFSRFFWLWVVNELIMDHGSFSYEIFKIFMWSYNPTFSFQSWPINYGKRRTWLLYYHCRFTFYDLFLCVWISFLRATKCWYLCSSLWLKLYLPYLLSIPIMNLIFHRRKGQRKRSYR